jgi:hypothetical protein
MVYCVFGGDGYINDVNRFGEKYGQQLKRLYYSSHYVYNKCESLSPVTAAEDNI